MSAIGWRAGTACGKKDLSGLACRWRLTIEHRSYGRHGTPARMGRSRLRGCLPEHRGPPCQSRLFNGPLLEEAMSHLGQTDRDAVVLRFMEERSLQEVGQALGLTEEAARKRVHRAVEKLRSIFSRRGIAASSGLLMAALSASAAQAA